MNFQGKSALVSGGGTGIGRMIALALAAQGATVHVVGLDEKEVAAQAPERITRVHCDIRDTGPWRQIISEAAPLDIMINNAAISLPMDILDSDLSKWNQVFETNFQATLHGCREAARLMKARGGGRIVNISSVQGRLCERGNAAYGIAKSAVDQLTRCLAVELARDGILVNAVSPGFVDTPMSRATGTNELETDWFRSHFIDSGRIPLGRPARPEEIARAVLFLASEENTYITGQILPVDGGLTLTL